MPMVVPPQIAGGIMDKVRENTSYVHFVLVNNYQRMKEFLTTRAASQVQHYEKLSLFGKLTYVEGAFFRLVKFCLRRALGVFIPEAAQSQFISKFFYYLSVFSSFTGIALPTTITAIGITTLESVLKMTLLASGCHFMGIILATNIAIMILFYTKKVLQNRGEIMKSIVRKVFNPTTISKFIPAEFSIQAFKDKFKQVFFQTVDLENIQESPLLSESFTEEESAQTEDSVSILPDVPINNQGLDMEVDENNDATAMQSLFTSTFDIVNNTNDVIGSPSPSLLENIDPNIDLSKFKIPKGISADILKKIACTLVNNIKLEGDTTQSDQLKTVIDTLITVLRAKAGGSGTNVIVTLKRMSKTSLQDYYRFASGKAANKEWSKHDIITRILEHHSRKIN